MSVECRLPSQERLHEVLRYTEADGSLWWKPRGNPQFDGRLAGTRALNWRSAKHCHGHVLGVACLAHRVIWKMAYGDLPSEIDHINGNGFDNRLSNLRAVTHRENSLNSRRSKSNSSGHCGVSFVQRTGRWRAYITAHGKQHHLGYFTNREGAIEARKQADADYGFHDNHGANVVMLQFLPKIRSAKLMASAAGQPCSLRLPMICNHDPSTTVLAHLPGIGKGIGTKVSDIHAVYACQACHDAIDLHAYEKVGLTSAIVLDAMLRGLCETQARWVEQDLIQVPDGEVI